MEKEQPRTIDADTVRKMQLNAEINPRKTVYGEATQNINPLTGHRYEDHFIPMCALGRVKNIISSGLHEEESFLYEDRPPKYHYNKLSILPKQGPRTNQTIELQKTLGSMEVREGKLPEFLYEQFLDNLDRLAEIYTENPNLTLDSITSLSGLNAALGIIERKGKPEKNFYTHSPDKILLNNLFPPESIIKKSFCN